MPHCVRTRLERKSSDERNFSRSGSKRQAHVLPFAENRPPKAACFLFLCALLREIRCGIEKSPQALPEGISYVDLVRKERDYSSTFT